MISIESQWFPVIVTSWSGPYDQRNVDAFFAEQRRLADRAMREETWLAVIAKIGEAPDAAARKLIADATQAMPAVLRARTLRSFVIVENGLQRGVVTAVTWLVKDLAELQPVANEREAIAGARKALEARGVAFPEGVDERLVKMLWKV